VEDNIITNNIGSGVSISLIEGKSATVANNKIDNNAGSSSDGIYVSIAGTGGLMIIENNPVTRSGRYGIYLRGVKTGSTVANFNVESSGSHGLYSVSSDLNLENVTITDNTNLGIYFYSGKAFTLRNSTINGNGGGIIYGGNAAIGDAVVEDNIITNNIGSGVSISLIEGKSATVANNKIDNNVGSSSDGIYVSIAGTGGLMIIENNPVTRSGRYGIYLRGVRTDSTVANFSVESSGSYGLYAVSSDLNVENVTITDSTKSGIYFYSGKGFAVHDSKIDGNAGGIIYGGNAGIGDAIVEDTIITNNVGSGVLLILAQDKSATIKNNIINNNAGSLSDGIYVNIAGTGGVSTIENNSVQNSGRYGMYLTKVVNSALVDNNVSNNLYGLNLYLSSNNLIHHNIFIDNSNYNANDNTGTNSWDNGYPDGGNYWGDYTGVDNNKGPNQDEPGSDGIGDTQYDISGGAGANDSYPLMSVTQNPTTYTISVSTSPSGLIPQPLGGGTYTSGQTATVTAQSVTGYTFRNWTENSNQVSTSASYPFTVTGDRNLVAVYTNTDGIVGDINDDGVVNYIDLGILGASYGLSLEEAGYNVAADLNGDGIVNYIDLGMLGANYGKTS
jgi:parallel beta-helix repeat protein